MKKLLIILTHKYPFEPPTEQFLHNEVSYYSGFDVLFVPLSSKINYDSKYEFSCGHCSVIKQKRVSRFKALFFYVLFFIAQFPFIVSDIRRLGIRCCKNVLLHRVKSQYIFSSLKRSILSSCMEYESVVIYSYWLNAYAIAGELLKEYLKNKGKEKVVSISRAHGQGDLYLLDDKSERDRPCLDILRRLDAILSISEDGVSHLIRCGLSNLFLSRLGIENNYEFCLIHQNTDLFQVASCSVVSDNKNVLCIAKALALLQFKVKWVHFGNGPLFEELKRWCEENMPSNVEYVLLGNVSNKEIMEYYFNERPDVFVNLSRIEGIPVSIMEAQSFGIPCIATDVGSTREIVNDLNGFLIKYPFQISDVLTALNCIRSLSDFEYRAKSIEAKKHWDLNYNANKTYVGFVKKLNRLFESAKYE